LRPRVRLTRRRVAIILTGFLLACVVVIIGLGWYFSGRLIAVTRVTDSYPLHVIAVDVSHGSVTLNRGPDAAEPGTFRLAWASGHAVVGGTITGTSATVTRHLSAVEGQMKVGLRVGIEPDPYTGDPGSAFGLGFDRVSVPSALGGLPAWFIPGPRLTWVILIHGLGGSRVDTLAAVPALHALGYPILSISYRNDAGAPPSRDHRSHLGGTEWHDVDAAVNYAMGHHSSGVVLFGYSLGGGMALIVARDTAVKSDVRAVIADSPVLDWAATIKYAANRRGIPQPFTTLVETLVGYRIHLDYSQFNQLHHERSLLVPVLLIQGQADTVVPPRLAARFAADRQDLVTYLPVPGADHVSAIDTEPANYRLALQRFLWGYP
jgi:pimeloyl-ACP methyl ester carboxylesterase